VKYIASTVFVYALVAIWLWRHVYHQRLRAATSDAQRLWAQVDANVAVIGLNVTLTAIMVVAGLILRWML
jgi:hypothetical protein